MIALTLVRDGKARTILTEAAALKASGITLDRLERAGFRVAIDYLPKAARGVDAQACQDGQIDR